MLRLAARLRLVTCAVLGLLWAVKVPVQARIETAGGAVAVAIAAWYLAVILVSRRSSLGASALAIGGALLSTPYMAIIWLFSQWSTESASTSRWMLYAITGNAILFPMSMVEVAAALRRRHAGPRLEGE